MVWKFKDFSVTEILRELNFEESTTSKTAVFTIFGARNFLNLVNLSFLKVQISYKSKSTAL